MIIIVIFLIIGLIIFFRRKKSKNSFADNSHINISSSSSIIESTEQSFDDNIGTLLKKATELKKNGNIDSAIETLKLAYSEIKKTNTTYSINTFLRLPLYLQEAKKNDQAWKEFNNLLSQGYPNYDRDQEVWPAEEGIIYDKMRLFLQREGKHNLAISFGIFSHLKWTIAVYRQKRNEELKSYQNKNEISEMLKPLLKKAMKDNLSNELVELVSNETANPSKINIAEVTKKIAELIKEK